MFTPIVFWLVLTWNWLLQSIGRILGQLTGGLVLGYMRGMRDLSKMQDYMRYRAAAAAALKNGDKDPM